MYQAENKPCVFEKILSNHVGNKLVMERVLCDQALIRTNVLLQQTKELKHQLNNLSDEFHGLENNLQKVNCMYRHFNYSARRRLNYFDERTSMTIPVTFQVESNAEESLLCSVKNRNQSPHESSLYTSERINKPEKKKRCLKRNVAF